MPANRLNSQMVSGRVESTMQGMCIGSSSVMPEANQYRFGIVMQYLGDTGQGFVKNHFYKCESRDDAYVWADVTPSIDVIYTPNVVLGTNAQGLTIPMEVSVTELETLQGAESNIQEQIDTLTTNTSTALDGKVDKIPDMGLSEENFTSREKEKLASVQYNAQANNIEEIQVNNVTVQPQDKIVNIPMLEGHTYPVGDLHVGEGFEVKHNLIRTVYFAQVRDGNGNVVNGSMQVNDTVATIIPDENATNCTMYIICGGI